MHLTVKRVERLTKPGRYGDGHGLYLRIGPTGHKTWVLRWERNGRERMMGLGALHTFNLDEARERARQARQQLADGIDPIEAKKASMTAQAIEAAKAVTFADAALRYHEAHSARWTNPKHRAQFLSTLKQYAFPVFGTVPVASIDMPLVLKALEPIWRTIPESASRIRGRIESVLDFATVRGWRTGDNPARWSGWLSHALPSPNTLKTGAHHAAMAFDEVPAFLAALAQREGIAARALEMTILTASRTSEITGARWSEFNLKAAVWTIPGERMKAKKPHRVPLSEPVLTVLRELPREAQYVFPGSKAKEPLSNMAMAAVLKRMGRNDVTVHGFRSSFRDWVAERTATPNIIAEAALAHTVADKVEAAYRRGDLLTKRAKLMNDWAAFCMTPRPTTATVTNIGAARAKKA